MWTTLKSILLIMLSLAWAVIVIVTASVCASEVDNAFKKKKDRINIILAVIIVAAFEALVTLLLIRLARYW